MTPLDRVRTGVALLLWAGASLLNGKEPVKAAPAAAEIVAPIELIHDKPYVMVTVNGRGPYRFLLDTGTGTEALISPELVQELGIPKVGHARLKDMSGVGEQRSDVVWVESIKIGSIEFDDVQAVEHRLFREEQNCQGVLGFPLFENYLLTLDYPGRKLILSSGTLEQHAGGSIVPLRVTDGVPIVMISIAGHSVDAQIDSGGTGLSLPDALAEQIRFQSAPVEYGIAESLTTRYSLKAARLQPDVRFGPYVFRKAFVEINSAFPVVNVGSTPLKNLVLTFDQQEGLMSVYGKDRIMSLDASPVLMQMQSEPPRQASDAKLVPVG